MGRALGRVRPTKGAAYPGDFRGNPAISYEPNPGNGKVADPGEIVWTWVPFEEDHSQGKDRPVLVIGHDGPWLLALPLTTKDHDLDVAQEARAGRHWTDIGSGPWDHRGRDSEVRLDRILRVDPAGVAAWERSLTKVGSTRSPRHCEGRHPEGRPSLVWS